MYLKNIAKLKRFTSICKVKKEKNSLTEKNAVKLKYDYHVNF